MACTVASVSGLAVPAVVSQLGVSTVPSRTSVVLGAPKTGFSSMVFRNKSKVVMSSAPQKEHDVPGLTAMALVAASIIPEIAEAVQPGVSPSLKNLLFSVIAGGVVLVALGVAVAGVSTFDPVKRR